MSFGANLEVVSKENKNMESKQNLPNAGKLVTSLRSTGYDNVAAICDLIDNSIDAQATNIKVKIEESKGEVAVMIADDGNGMDEKILFEALKLGSLTDRDTDSDLGRYGMGLVTASWSFCKNILVLTKAKNGKLLRNEIDIDVITEKNEFLCMSGEASKEEAEFFQKYVDSDSGTLVRLTKCDRIQNPDIVAFSGAVAKKVGQMYRYFIRSGINFLVNDKEVEVIDPLMLDDKRTEIFSDETYEILLKDSGAKESIRVKIAIIPKFPDKLGNQLPIKINQYAQGFYVLRNNREIASAITLGLFTRHNSANRVRIELMFSGKLDHEMGVNFMKQNIAPTQAIMDKLREEVKGQVDTLKRRFMREAPRSEDEAISHDNAEKIIANQAKLLITPDAEIEKRQSPQKREMVGKTIREAKKRIRQEFEKVHLSKRGMGCKFLEKPMGEAGPIFEADQKGKLIIVEWNSDHPFYKKFVLANKDDSNMLAAADLLVYAMATAELKTFNSDENFDMLVNFKTVISANLRTLLS